MHNYYVKTNNYLNAWFNNPLLKNHTFYLFEHSSMAQLHKAVGPKKNAYLSVILITTIWTKINLY